MKVLLLGATGRTGRLILLELLAKGHAVNVIVRDRGKVEVSSTELATFEGSTLNEDLVADAIEGCDAVISALNISRNSDFPWSALRTPKSLMSDTITLVISMAKHYHIKRIIVLSAWGAGETINDIPWWFRLTIQLSNIKYGYLDHERQEKILMDSNMDWTAIRPVALVNSKADKQVKVVLDSSSRPSLIISRRSVAVFTVGILEKGEYIRMQPVIFGG